MKKSFKLIRWIIKNHDKITWPKVKNFLEAKWRQTFSSGADWRMEQFYWRETQVAIKSPQCLLKGECIHCGCEIPDKFFETDPCEQGCYPEWKEKEEWEIFKQAIQ